MPRQAGYIIQAILLLVSASVLVFLFQKFSQSTGHRSPSYTVHTTIDNVPGGDKLPDGLAAGRAVFQSRCASCHSIFKEGTGPALAGFEDRHKWADRKELYKWIRNPSAYIVNDAYTRGLKDKYGSVMTAFPELSDTDIDAIAGYINDRILYKSMPAPVAAR